MFRQMKNIDTTFRQMRFFFLVAVLCCFSFTIYREYLITEREEAKHEKIYILYNGKVFEAFASSRKENIAVEARDHVKTFHHWFFTLDPDDKVINTNITKALYLADRSAKEQYDNLRENNYYSNLISANISQEIIIDSVHVDINQYPFYFKCYAQQKIIRPSTIVTRSLVTDGHLRNVSRSDNNPHGFLIERWRTLENKDVKTENR